MRRLTVFDSISLDGYFTDAQGRMDWAKEGPRDPEFDAFTAENARGGGVLLFGRKTYELMASFWPTPAAKAAMPVVAERMNALPKIVFSRTLASVEWENATLVGGDLESAVRALKGTPGPDVAILGSGSIVAQLAGAGLVDEYQLVVVPVALGAGRTLFEGLTRKLDFTLVRSRTFKNGRAFLAYAPR